MILKDCASNFVLGEFPSISRCPNMRKHPPPHPKRPPAGAAEAHIPGKLPTPATPKMESQHRESPKNAHPHHPPQTVPKPWQ